MIPESESDSESKPGLVESDWNRNHMMLESESELESSYLGNIGIGVRIGIISYWNRNWNHGFW